MEFQVVDRFREAVGSVTLAVDRPAGLLRVESARLDPSYQGRGIAAAVYLKIDAWAEARGLRLASDYARSPQAERLWAGMAHRGLARLVDDPKVGGRYYVMEVAMMPARSAWDALIEGGRPNPIVGGVGDKLDPDDVSDDELRIGSEDEREHSPDPAVAIDIALDHLAQDPHYYSKHESAWSVGLRLILGGA